MASWIAFPYDADDYVHDAAALRKHWARLHRGDAEPFPPDAAVQAAWALFHAGRFEEARDAGLRAGADGLIVANKAQAIYAQALEPAEKQRLALFAEVAARAEAQARANPGLANAHYWQAVALGRCAGFVNVATAASQGLGARVKAALETTIALAPRHADARIALGAFHAETIDTFGKLPGRAHGADGATGLKLFREALALNPDSALARMEYAKGLVMLEGDRRMQEAGQLLEEAAACTPMDAAERLDVEMAKEALADE